MMQVARAKPPFTYFGGKTRIARRIVDVMPAHGHYVEPFAGALSVLLAKPPAHMETVNDLDGHLVNFWRVLRDKPDELARLCALTPHSRAELANADLANDLDSVERARRTWVQLTQGRGGSLRTTGWRFRVNPSSGSNFSMPDYLSAYVERFGPCVRRMAGVSLENRDGIEVINDYGRHIDVLLYVDPHYPATVRSANSYRVEMQDDAAHEALLSAVLNAESAVLMSGYANPLYDDALAGWEHTDIAATTGTNAARWERIWCNREMCGQMRMLANPTPPDGVSGDG